MTSKTLRKFLKDNSIRQEAVARRSGYSRAAISRIANGSRHPRPFTWECIQQAVARILAERRDASDKIATNSAGLYPRP